MKDSASADKELKQLKQFKEKLVGRELLNVVVSQANNSFQPCKRALHSSSSLKDDLYTVLAGSTIIEVSPVQP